MYWETLAKKHQKSGVLVDTNLLLILLIGKIDRRLIGGKRTEIYTEDHFHILVDFLNKFQWLITTPHILAEVSNLGGAALTGKYREEFLALLCTPSLFDIKATDELVIERHIRRQDVETSHIQRLGLTDAAITRLCTKKRRRVLLLSNDLDLVELVVRLHGDAINFNHIWEAKRNL